MPRIVNLANLTPFQATSLTDPGYKPGAKIIPSCCLVRLNFSLTDGRIAHMVLHSQYNGTPALSAAVAQGLFATISTGGSWTGLAAFLATTMTFTGVTVLDLRSVTGLSFDSTGAAVAGGATGQAALPDEVALVISMKTANRGPAARGRAYMPGWASSAVAAGGVVTGGAVTALNTWFAAVATAMGTAIGPLVLALPERNAYTSPATGRAFPHRDATTLLVTTTGVRDNHWDSQRRRGLK